MYPNRFAYTEFLARRVFRMEFHKRRHSPGSLREKLREAGFEAVSIGHCQMFPRNFSFLPGKLRRMATGCPAPLLAADGLLSRVPLIRRLGATLEGIFRKREK